MVKKSDVSFLLFCLFASFSGCGAEPSTFAPAEAADVIPADRRTVWNPGLSAVGGIPHRTTIYRTLSPSGGDDTAAIQTALDGCPANQVVKLNAGTFKITGDGLNFRDLELHPAGLRHRHPRLGCRRHPPRQGGP